MLFRSQGAIVKVAPAEPEQAVRRQDLPVVVRIPEEFPRQWAEGGPAEIEVIADPSRRESEIPMRRVKSLLNVYGQQLGQLRLQLRGIAPSVAAPIMILDVDLSTPQSRGLLFMIFLPYMSIGYC